MFIRELTESVHTVYGIGKASAETLKKLEIHTLADLLQFFPRAYEDRKNKVPLNAVFSSPAGAAYVNTQVRVIAHDYIGWGRKQTLKVYVEDDSATGALVCFGRNFLAKKLLPGKEFYLFGKFIFKYQEIQSSTFEVEPAGRPPKMFGRILPVYPLTGNLTSNFFRKTIYRAIESHGKFIESEIPDRLRNKHRLLSKADAVRAVHFPQAWETLKQAKRTLIYEELFYLQLTLGKYKSAQRKTVREKRTYSTELYRKLLASLPFELTKDQLAVIDEIRSDITSDRPMSRLLQGDVGSGKTLVALLTAVQFIEEGSQTTFMAPTELLAKQHADNCAQLLAPLGIRTAFLSGTVTGNKRKQLLLSLRNGEIDLLVGTHALFSKDVVFKELKFIIIDEQHRFGVLQRYAMASKADAPDILLMTATPIPRTLAMTVFSDLDISTIRTMPKNRKPVITHLARIGNEKKVYIRVKEELAKGHQAYFVYPLIEESDKWALKNAEGMFEYLKNEVFQDTEMGLIHSRIGEDEKYAVMRRFVNREIRVLVATSVVEVGVDVPNATCIVIEHADRFGLAALHQLRGRVGRGVYQSYAFLVFSEELTEEGKQRLKVMKESNDGFYIAEEDLKLRGAGNIAGTKQSGFFQLSIADPLAHIDTMKQAREDTIEVLEQDPELTTPENRVLAEVLKRAPPFSKDMLVQG